MDTGIHSLSFEQYQAAKGINASALKILHTRTPMHLRCLLEGVAPEPTAAQRFGTLTHRCIFEPDTMEGAFYVKPDGMTFTTKDGKAWKEEHRDKPIITADDVNTIKAIVTAIHQHPSAARLLKNADFERSCFAEDGQGTMRKFRPDILPRSGNVLVDLKTCESAAVDDFEKQIWNYKYFYSAAFYMDGCELLGRDFEHFVYVAAEKTPPYAVACYDLDPLAIEAGRKFYERDLAVYRECLETERWPGYGDGIGDISLPSFAQKQLEQYL